eukprot:maker-scaffold_1-snap-gene-26.52-mRNA-1 protein AED:0.00 eAED:0.00 QI:89/1/1/1/1/1/3/104/713
MENNPNDRPNIRDPHSSVLPLGELNEMAMQTVRGENGSWEKEKETEQVPEYSGKPRVVILGAGYGGAACANRLQKILGKKIDLTVIEKRQCSVHKIGGARASALGQAYVDRVLIPNYDLVKPGKGRIVHENIRQVSDKFVQIGDGSKLYYDYLVAATGGTNLSLGEPPLKYKDRSDMVKYYEKISRKIQAARSICIIGGGAVGVETAGEIKYQYPEKLVCIVHSGKRLLNRVTPLRKSFQDQLLDQMNEMGIGLFLNQRLELPKKKFKKKPYMSGPREFYTNLGQKVSSDLFLLCTGKTLNNNVYPKNWMDAGTGQLNVKKTLQLVKQPNVFAVGDINDFPENKQAYFAGKQGEVAAENIKKLIKKSKYDINSVVLKNYKAGFGTGKSYIFVSLGREFGVTNFGYTTLGARMTARFKSKDLFTKTQWKVYRQKNVPKIEESIPVGGDFNNANYYEQANNSMAPLQRFDTLASMQSFTTYDSNRQGSDTGSVMSSQVGGMAHSTMPRNNTSVFAEQTVPPSPGAASSFSFSKPAPPTAGNTGMKFSNNPRPTSYNPRSVAGVKPRKKPMSNAFNRNNIISFVGSRDRSRISARMSQRIQTSQQRHKTIFKPMTDMEISVANGTLNRPKHKKNLQEIPTVRTYDDDDDEEDDEEDEFPEPASRPKKQVDLEILKGNVPDSAQAQQKIDDLEYLEAGLPDVTPGSGRRGSMPSVIA